MRTKCTRTRNRDLERKATIFAACPGHIAAPMVTSNFKQRGKPILKTDKNGFCVDETGQLIFDHVTSARTVALEYADATLIGLRLFDQDAPRSNSRGDCNQFRMTTQTARRIAEFLTMAADDIDGICHPRQ